MDCERAKGLIVDFLYDELAPEYASDLHMHLAECESCSKYREELHYTLECLDKVRDLQAPVDLAALHDAVDRKRHRVKRFFRRWPVWVPIGACGVMLLMVPLFVSEIRYENDVLTIRLNGQEGEPVAERADRMLATYREDQLQFQKQMADELRVSAAVLLKVIDEYEAHRNKQLAGAFRQIQSRQNQILLATQKELENLALNTEDRMKRNYLMTMAAVAGMVDAP